MNPPLLDRAPGGAAAFLRDMSPGYLMNIADLLAPDAVLPGLKAQSKKQLLQELNEALKAAQPVQFPSNVELVKKYYDKINAALG